MIANFRGKLKALRADAEKRFLFNALKCWILHDYVSVWRARNSTQGGKPREKREREWEQEIAAGRRSASNSETDSASESTRRARTCDGLREGEREREREREHARVLLNR